MSRSRLIAALAAATALAAVALWPVVGPLLAPRPRPPQPETIRLDAGTFLLRPSGTYQRAGRRVDPPLFTVTMPALEMMKYPVSAADYAACVGAGACAPADASAAQARRSAGGDAAARFPQTGVNWHDASAYARWLSRRTGEVWRLPTEAEWQRAAAERFTDDAADLDGSDPAKRWLADYARNIEARENAAAPLRPLGGFGENSLGLADLAGNVWEWTDTCLIRGQIGDDGRITATEDYCGARIAAGQHRAQIIDFVRDPRAGGCGAGLPPDNLGFRLLREVD